MILLLFLSSVKLMEYQSIAGSNVCYHMESSLGSPLGPGTGIVVYEVNEVYLYIPAELCAAGFELKIAGVVRIVDKVSKQRLAN